MTGLCVRTVLKESKASKMILLISPVEFGKLISNSVFSFLLAKFKI